ncbi:MAG: glycosyltransferase family 8 protein [Sphingobacteriales bacterium]|nr:MAG: glycosyltransferase family 8 protein [Sphingobacteriales bacterium]
MPIDKGTTMNIVIGIDKGFIQHGMVMLTSLLTNNADTHIELYVLHTEYFPDLKHIQDLQSKFDVKVNMITVKPADLGNVKVDGHISIATYYRLLIGELLPQDCDKVMYLDCDMVIVGSLLPFWNTTITGDNIVAAIPEQESETKHLLGIKPDEEYFNAGVLLIDLVKWRSACMGKQLVQYLENNRDKIKYWDQDVLNGVLIHKWAMLGKQWNYITRYTYPEKIEPVIIHYAGQGKPWTEGFEDPFGHYYFQYLKKTPYYSSHVTKEIKRKASNLINKIMGK